MPEKYRIEWQSQLTGAGGHGDDLELPREDMEKCAAENNKMSPGIIHWVSAAGQSTAPVTILGTGRAV